MLQTSDLRRGIRPLILNCLGHQEPPYEALERTSAIYTKWVAQVWPQTQCVRAIGPANLIQQGRRPRAETGHRTAGLHKDWSLNLGPNSPCINVQPTLMELKNLLWNIGSECSTRGKWYVDNCPIHAHLAGQSAVGPTPENVGYSTIGTSKRGALPGVAQCDLPGERYPSPSPPRTKIDPCERKFQPPRTKMWPPRLLLVPQDRNRGHPHGTSNEIWTPPPFPLRSRGSGEGKGGGAIVRRLLVGRKHKIRVGGRVGCCGCELG